MFEKSRVQHPLEILTEIERGAAVDQEILLRDGATPWAELLADYVDALNELATRGTADNGYIATYGLDEGHAGGCG
ncbi:MULTISPECIES: DUF6269 family protein [unclassified Streptomyces]|uniref:DUF6269 family protein n=1 Tax=unclassified Streptomyces TaxID=2593676 RepID=UPI00226D4545|nr:MULTISPECIES: DUF6269 family protein [unclassified Streptomyces]MCY0920154.1 hypothetical protein [Streptomyces sp. H27-G5]MCY0963143.1 hypothetical protein [Streptomyces sp. H27-H5]